MEYGVRAAGIAARAAAGAARRIAPHVKRNIIEFDRTLQRELGISLIEKPVRTRIAPAARYTYQAAKWAAPRAKKGAQAAYGWIKEHLPVVRKAVSGFGRIR